MLNVLIPKTKYNLTDYPNLEDNAETLPVPEFWGVKTNITPICIDTTTGKFKLSKRKLKAIDAIRADGKTLVVTDDYTADLANGEFTIISTPKLSAATVYYIVIEGDFTVNASNYVILNGDDDAGYAGGQAFHVDGGDSWTGQTADIRFRIFGKNDIDGEEELKISFNLYTDYWAGLLREDAAQTKLAQSFTTPAGDDFYITRILLAAKKVGSPTGNLWCSIHSDQVGTQVGIKSNSIDVSRMKTKPNVTTITFPQRGIPSEIQVDAQGWYTNSTLMENVADILEDVAENIVGVPSASLDDTALAALKAARTEDLCIYLDSEISFGQFIEKLEAGSLFKFMPQLDGTYAPIYYASGEPAGTPHLRDEDLKSFSCYRNLESVKQKYIIKYNENPTTQLYLEKESESEIAEYLYKNKEILEIETYLKDAADATTRATDYKGLLQLPQRGINFEVASYLLDKIPTNKVKITRTRGDNTSGTFDAVLFRILRLSKNQATGTVTCKAVLDSQTY